MPSLVRNSFFSTLSLSVKFGTNAVLSILLARALGVDDFGRFVFATTFTGIFAIIVDYSFNVQVVREVANAPDEALSIVQRMLSAKLLLSLACTVLVASTVMISQPRETGRALLVLWLGALCFSLGQFLNNVFKGLNLFHRETYPMLFLNCAQLLFISALVAVGAGIVIIASGYTAARMLYLGLSYGYFYRRFGRLHFRVRFREGVKALYRLLPFGVYSMLGLIYLQMDTIMLAYMKDDSQVGHYQAAMRVAFATTVVCEIILSAFLPLLAKVIRAEGTEFRDQALLLNKYLFVIGFMIASFLAIFADGTITFLYGSSYASSVILLRVLAVMVFLRFAGAGFGMIISISNHQKWCPAAVTLPAVMNLFLNCYAIPRHGAVGAAVTSVLTHLLLGFLYALFTYKAVGGLFLGKLCLRGGGITAIVAVAAGYLKQFETEWAITLFLILPLLLARFALSRDEMEELRRLLKKGFSWSVAGDVRD